MSRITTQQAELKRHFRVGSTYFFSQYPDFKARDIDEVVFEDQPKLYKNVLQFRKRDRTHCLFKWRLMTADEFVEYTLNSKLPMELGKFLVPEVCEHLGFTLDHLEKLSSVADRLDAKHAYEKIIFNSYLENGNFILTDEQRYSAYVEYLRSRQN